jgi:hypothetical protein
MKRLGSFAPALAVVALVAGCSDNNTPGAPVRYSKLTVLADFETGSGFNPAPDIGWSGAFAPSGDSSAGGTMSMTPDKFVAKQEPLSAPRKNPDGSMSVGAFHAHDDGEHVFWGTAWFAALNNYQPVDLSHYSGMVLWAKSDGYAGTTVKIGLSDRGSEPNDPTHVCDPNDNTVGGKGCYDDYSAKFYPDGVWRQYDISFSSLTTGGWGLPHQFDPSKLFTMKFSMLPGVKYDIWIDDITFYTR